MIAAIAAVRSVIALRSSITATRTTAIITKARSVATFDPDSSR